MASLATGGDDPPDVAGVQYLSSILRLLASFITFAVFLFFTSSLLFTFHSPYRDLYSSGLNSGTYGLVSIRRSVLALKSDSLKPRLDQIRKQADDHRALAVAYASYARKLKVENSKMAHLAQPERDGNLQRNEDMMMSLVKWMRNDMTSENSSQAIDLRKRPTYYPARYQAGKRDSDDDIDSRITDFGLVEAMPAAHTHINALNVAGTAEYIDQECHLRGYLQV
ncbi:hypothetical protein WN943_022507 [Citrus x changshan-huyou]